jgi:hypothetical protein
MLYMSGVFSPRSSFAGQRKLAIFLSGRPTDLMLCLDNAIEGRVDKRKKGDRSGILRGGSDSLRWMEAPSDLPVTIAVTLESVLQKFKFIMKTFLITQGSGSMYQRGKHSLFIGRVVVRVGMEIEVGEYLV